MWICYDFFTIFNVTILLRFLVLRFCYDFQCYDFVTIFHVTILLRKSTLFFKTLRFLLRKVDDFVTKSRHLVDVS